IRAQLEVALDHPDGLDWPETARDVHADTLRLARLTEDLLLLARLDGQHLRRTPTDLSAVCGSVVARYSAARVPVRADATAPTPGPCVIAGDPDALSRLLVNLLDNAVRHAASQVCASTRDGPSWWCPTTGRVSPPKTPNGPSAGSRAWTTRGPGPGKRAWPGPA